MGRVGERISARPPVVGGCERLCSDELPVQPEARARTHRMLVGQRLRVSHASVGGISGLVSGVRGGVVCSSCLSVPPHVRWYPGRHATSRRRNAVALTLRPARGLGKVLALLVCSGCFWGF